MTTIAEQLAEALRACMVASNAKGGEQAVRSAVMSTAAKAIAEYDAEQKRSELKTETLHLYEQNKKGFWLWDETREMNLSMHAVSASAAFVEALEYYQGRLTEVEKQHAALDAKVQAFVSQFVKDDDGPEF